MTYLSLLQVSKLGYGCMGLTGFYNAPISVEDGVAIVKEAFNNGITFFDTADVYGKEHSNEYMIGQVTRLDPRYDGVPSDQYIIASSFLPL